MVHVEPPEPEAAGSNPAGPAGENVIYCRAHSVPFARADNRRCLHQGRGGRSERVGGPAFFIGTALHLLGAAGFIGSRPPAATIVLRRRPFYRMRGTGDEAAEGV